MFLYLLTTLVLLLLPLQEVEIDKYKTQHVNMVRDLVSRGITDKRVLAAMESVKRHLFVPQNLQQQAYGDHPLPIGEGQTISQPYMVAFMTQELQVDSTDKVLEIGTGSAYQAAILSQLVDTVFTIEIKSKLAARAEKRIQKLSYKNIQTKCADGYFGWPERAPFDAIMITCAVNHVPPPLLDQLKVGGRMILPLGSSRYYQILIRLTKTEGQVEVEYLGTVAFVPMTGKAEKT
jgi:protein-L-isoaspartate(D-aspartate) O-methyltransferase